MARKKKKARARQSEAADTEEVDDELVALLAIFPDTQLDGDERGLELSVRPHHGDTDSSHVSATLHFRFPPAYPKQPAELRVVDCTGLQVKQARQLSKLLHQKADACALEGKVCAFDLVDLCQEWLQDHNKPAEDAALEHKSLWHNMVQGDQSAGSAHHEDSFLSPAGPRTARWTDTDAGGLFASAGEDPTWQSSQLSRAAWPAAAKTSSPSRLTAPAKAQPRPAPAASQALTVGHRPSEVSSSMVEGMISAVRSRFSAIGRVMASLPPSLRLLLDSGSAQADDAAAEPHDTGRDTKQLQLDVLMGHLLSLAMERNPQATAFPPHALSALAAHLTAQGLLPSWVQRLLTQSPALFNRAFAKLFADMPRAADSDPDAGWLLERFWSRSAPSAQAQVPVAAPSSRYQSDFQELHAIGKGGYGTVVAAINRLDGRKYAVKRIALNAQSPASYARILREVSTLSRLQHPHVVRYFQAWCEDAAGGVQPDTSSDEQQLEDWLGATDTGQLASPFAPHDDSAVLFQDSLTPRKSPVGKNALDCVEEANESAAAGIVEQESVTETDSGTGFFRHGNRTSTDDESELAGTQPQSSAPSQPANKVGTLFIQMEFCPRTLQQVLLQGPVAEEDAWQVVRQVLAGLAHIHAQGIIHRDLKPANIFYDARGDVKLGDFGLAKFNLSSAVQAGLGLEDSALSTPAEQPGHLPGHRSLPSEATGQVGTSFYISPEIAAGGLHYDEKVDIFSLGIIIFELWHPFSTGMERVILLRALQQDGDVPADFEQDYPGVSSLIRQVMAHDPCNRPTARELLRSELVPPAVGDEQLTDLLRSLPDSRDKYDRVVDALFSQPMPDVGLPGEQVAGYPVAAQVDAQQTVSEAITAVCASHGAVHMASTTVGACPPDTQQNAAVVLSPDGPRLALRYDLRAPFASWLAARAAAPGGLTLEAMRRYEVAWVRRKALGRAVPRSHLQADMDIVTASGQASADALLGEAECLKAVTEILERLPEAADSYEIRLSHSYILDAALGLIGIPRDLQERTLHLLSAAFSVSACQTSGQRASVWPSIRAALEGLGIDSAAVQLCKQFLLQVPGEADSSLHRLQAKLATARSRLPRQSSLPSVMDSLRILLGHLAAWQIPSAKVALEPLMRPHADYFSGVLFQVHLVNADSGSCSLVAVGGRYDALLKAVWPKAAPPMAAVGVSIAADGLVARVAAGRSVNKDSFPAASQAEVLVCARGGGGLLRDRMALVSQLWSAGIRAEMVHASAPSATEQYDYANARSIPVLVTLHGTTFSATDTVKVKHMRRREDEDVSCADLVKHLQVLLGHAAVGAPARNVSALKVQLDAAADAESVANDEVPRRRRK